MYSASVLAVRKRPPATSAGKTMTRSAECVAKWSSVKQQAQRHCTLRFGQCTSCCRLVRLGVAVSMKMPFSLRCVGSQAGRVGRYRPYDAHPSTIANNLELDADRSNDAEGHVECKSTTGNTFRTEQWTMRYCVLSNGKMCIYKDETKEESDVISIDLSGILEFTATYRFLRRHHGSGDDSSTVCGVFSFSDGCGGKVKLRVSSDADSNYWMAKFRNVFIKVPSKSSYAPNRRFTPVKSESSFDLLRSNAPAVRGPLWQKDRSVVLDPQWMKQSPTSYLPAKIQDPPRTQGDLRRRLANEFVETLRRADTMLESREINLRSKLDAGPEATTIASMQARVVTDHEEEISEMCRSSMLSSVATVRSQQTRPPSSRGRNEMRIDDKMTTIATTTVDEPNALPTIIDDHSPLEIIDSTQPRNDVSIAQISDARSPPSVILYTSSMCIRLNPNRPTKTVPIGVPQTNFGGRSVPSNRLTSFTTPQNVISYSMSNSSAAVASTMSLSSPGCSVWPVHPKATSTPASKWENVLSPPTPPPPPPLRFLSPPFPRDQLSSKLAPTTRPKSATKPVLPPSFLLELRAAAMKRQMSCNE